MHSVEEVSEAGLGQVSVEVARQHKYLFVGSSSDLTRIFLLDRHIAYLDFLLECILADEQI